MPRQVTFGCDHDLLEKVDRLRFRKRFESRSEAIKYLLRWAVDHPELSDKQERAAELESAAAMAEEDGRLWAGAKSTVVAIASGGLTLAALGISGQAFSPIGLAAPLVVGFAAFAAGRLKGRKRLEAAVACREEAARLRSAAIQRATRHGWPEVDRRMEVEAATDA